MRELIFQQTTSIQAVHKHLCSKKNDLYEYDNNLFLPSPSAETLRVVLGLLNDYRFNGNRFYNRLSVSKFKNW